MKSVFQASKVTGKGRDRGGPRWRRLRSSPPPASADLSGAQVNVSGKGVVSIGGPMVKIGRPPGAAMQNRTPDGKTFQEVIEEALEGRRRRGRRAKAWRLPGASSVRCSTRTTLAFTVASSCAGSTARIEPVEHLGPGRTPLRLRKGDRVILMMPTGWKQWVVTGRARARSRPPPESTEEVPS